MTPMYHHVMTVVSIRSHSQRNKPRVRPSVCVHLVITSMLPMYVPHVPGVLGHRVIASLHVYNVPLIQQHQLKLLALTRVLHVLRANISYQPMVALDKHVNYVPVVHINNGLAYKHHVYHVVVIQPPCHRQVQPILHCVCV
jgi:hypothetical protein